MKVPESIQNAVKKMPLRSRQWAMLVGVVVVAFGLLWVIISLGEPSDKSRKAKQAAAKVAGPGAKITNIGVMQPGAQISSQDQWVGQAGKKLSQWEHDRLEIDRRFADLEKSIRPGSAKPAAPGVTPTASLPAPPNGGYPPEALLNGGATSGGGDLDDGLPKTLPPKPKDGKGVAASDAASAQPPERNLVRVSIAQPPKAGPVTPLGPGGTPGQKREAPYKSSVETYLPVSFTRGIMLGGIDAPTGGQSQSNPHPVLIRLEDNAVLPNRFRSEIRECFVVAAGYGDISSERVYMRTENLSCVRHDGSTLEVAIHGTIYGDDGHVGVRGRLVEKQGQILAKALLAGLLSGIGQGVAQQGSTTTTSVFGATTTTDSTHAYQQGIGKGMGSALDRLANYYVRLAEQIFPVIEVDAGRMVDVVITKGVRIEATEPTKLSGREPAKAIARGGDDDY